MLQILAVTQKSILYIDTPASCTGVVLDDDNDDQVGSTAWNAKPLRLLSRRHMRAFSDFVLAPHDEIDMVQSDSRWVGWST